MEEYYWISNEDLVVETWSQIEVSGFLLISIRIPLMKMKMINFWADEEVVEVVTKIQL